MCIRDRYTIVTFHQTNGGAGDDPTASQEAKDRYNYYSPIGTPDGEIDGGYIQSQDLMSSVEEAGQREVAPTTLNVTQTYNGEGAFTVTATLVYLGEGFNPDLTDPTGIPQDIADGDTLDYEIQLFMIEHDVYALFRAWWHGVDSDGLQRKCWTTSNWQSRCRPRSSSHG